MVSAGQLARLYPSPTTRALSTAYAAYRIGRRAGRSARNLFNTRRRRNRSTNTSGTATGPQYYGGQATKPYKKQYKKRRQSRKRRARARKYYRSFAKTLRTVTGVALQKALFNSSITATVTGLPQAFIATHLYSYNSIASSSQDTGVRDIKKIRDSMTNTFYTDDIGINTKFMIDYAIMDMTLANAATNSLEIDIYHLTWKDNNEYGTFASFIAAMNVAQTSLTNTTTDRVTLQDRGATLFDCPTAISTGYINIISKEKVFLAGGESTNFQWKVKKPVSITSSELTADNTYFARKGLTHTWLVVFKNRIGTPIDSSGALSMGVTRTYGWRVEGINQAGTAVLAD